MDAEQDQEQEQKSLQEEVIGCLNNGTLEEAQELYKLLLIREPDNHWALSEIGWSFFQHGDAMNAAKALAEALDREPSNPNYHFRLAIVYWNCDDKMQSKAVEHFISSVKLNPTNADAFRYLGHYYCLSTQDKQRAAKCYQKCISIAPEDSEAGEALCDIFDFLGQETLELSTCQEVLQRSSLAYWAWRRMGYIQAQQRKWEDAVGSLQRAIRGYPTCADLWEALGHSYQQLGMLTAAVKAYSRATSLEEASRLFSFIQSGNILNSLGSYKKAIEQFKRALSCEPHNLAAVYGLASALHGMAKESIAIGAFGFAASLTKEASTILFTSAKLHGNVTALWKLLADIQITHSHCSPWEMEEGAYSDGTEAFRLSVLAWKHERLTSANIAKNAYAHALHLCPWQANLYKDIAISTELINHLTNKLSEQESWCLSEVMTLGALVLESNNSEFWTCMGCVSKQKAIQQHSFVRALQLDCSDASAWAYLGKLYMREGQRELARQAFDRARSANPLLALPWAGMSADERLAGSRVLHEAFSNCLYAVQLMPAAEFQLGLGRLAFLTSQLHSSKVLVALEQAVKQTPECPESHNLRGLAWESRGSFELAVLSYRQGLFALRHFGDPSKTSCSYDISVNLARALCKARKIEEAVNEYKCLDKEGALDAESLPVYCVALWHFGKANLALSIAEKLATSAKRNKSFAWLDILFQLRYHLVGPDSAMNDLLKIPKYIQQDSKFSLTAFAIAAINNSSKLPIFHSQNISCLFERERGPELYSVLALGEEISEKAFSRNVFLRKGLHMYPQSSLLRNQLGLNLVSSGEWKGAHVAVRCCSRELENAPGLQAPCPTTETLGAAIVACSNCGFTDGNRSASVMHVISELQRWCHFEPWNDTPWYLLVLNIFQKARILRFPSHLSRVIKRILSSRWDLFSTNLTCISPYHKVQLLICVSEVLLQGGEYSPAIEHAVSASQFSISTTASFLVHLQLARCYAIQEDWTSLHHEYMQCLQLQTKSKICWLTFCLLEAKYNLNGEKDPSGLNQNDLLDIKQPSMKAFWIAMAHLVHAQCLIWNNDLLSAEAAINEACLIWQQEACLHLIHGSLCLDLARKFECKNVASLLSQAIYRLIGAQHNSYTTLPMVSLMVAQAEASLGRGKSKWEKHLRLEWSAWPQDMKPAEIYFQMHLLSEGSENTSKGKKAFRPETSKTSKQWLLTALHLNPSCSRYWEALKQKFAQSF